MVAKAWIVAVVFRVMEEMVEEAVVIMVTEFVVVVKTMKYVVYSSLIKFDENVARSL